MGKEKIKCPLCEVELVYSVIPHTGHTELSTHIWKCEDCPFIGFEFWNDQNLKDLVKSIK